ncbi:hypothetical protein PENTCL1PPCAC_2747 [Pristionchus entomophagus]|uniref:Uncharacterized protein n=1 Tax=Pristionchus entomophagus TaxID=358040 RepID=A0AAV5SD00_9BILA|nr:hypothetical protein PENTCL1PPCAC_2747 [Pristionchus entomophagus]
MVSPMVRFVSHTMFGCVLLVGFILVQVSLLRLLIFDGFKEATSPLPNLHRIDRVMRRGNELLIEKYENRSRDPMELRWCKKIGEGWTKVVYECEGVAVKVPNTVGKNLRDCLEKEMDTSLKFRSEVCKRHLIESLIKDTITMTTFDGDPMVPELIAYHFPADSSTAERFQVSTPLGTPIDTISLLSMDWVDRMKLVQNITHFMQRNADRHFADLRRQQFVMINSLPHLIDFGDINFTANRTASSIHHAARLYDDFIDHFVHVGAPGGIDREILALAKLVNRHELTLDHIDEFIEKVVK